MATIEPLAKALKAIDAFPSSDDESSLLVAAKCRALMRGYHARWKNAGYIALSVEQIYTSPLFNPATQSQSRSFSMAGKIDCMAEHNGRTFLIDHKTTSQDITDPDSPYWRQLAIEGQVNHYFLLQWLHGVKPDGAVWDVIRKPSISPKKLSKADAASVLAFGKYCGVSISKESLDLLVADQCETVEMYEARLADDCTNVRPDWYFQRRPVPRMNHEVVEYASELWEHAQEMLHTRQRQKQTKALPPRNSGACLFYGSACKFLGICSGHDTADSDRWQRKQVVHNELAGDVSTDKAALTNSRVRTFQTCRRKEYYEYELGIERQDREESEALYFGTVIHEGLRAWWECFLKPTENCYDYGADAAGSESATVPCESSQLAK